MLEIFFHFGQNHFQRAGGDHFSILIDRAECIQLAIAVDAHGQNVVIGATVDFKYIAAIFILGPVPQRRSASGDGMAAKTLQFFLILLADEII